MIHSFPQHGNMAVWCKNSVTEGLEYRKKKVSGGMIWWECSQQRTFDCNRTVVTKIMASTFYYVLVAVLIAGWKSAPVFLVRSWNYAVGPCLFCEWTAQTTVTHIRQDTKLLHSDCTTCVSRTVMAKEWWRTRWQPSGTEFVIIIRWLL